MTDHREVVVVRWRGQTASVEDGLAALLTAYHLRTEAEKGEAVAEASDLPDRYRAEITDRGRRSPTTPYWWLSRATPPSGAWW